MCAKQPHMMSIAMQFEGKMLRPFSTTSWLLRKKRPAAGGTRQIMADLFPDCGKTFAVTGKRIKDHKTTHIYPAYFIDKTISEKDHTFNNQCSRLEYGMLIEYFWDAIKEGDGKRVFRCWKFQLPYLKNDPGSTKYALETL